MKRKSLIKIWAFGLLVFTQYACEDAKNNAINNMVYINEAASAKTKELTMQDGMTRTSLTIRLGQVTGQDIKANLYLNEAWLNEYNKKNETNYKLPLKENISFPESVIIKAGSVSADPINVDIKEFDTEGAQFAVPVCIQSVEGGVEKAESSSGFMLVLVKPLKQLVPKFTSTNGMKAAPAEDWNVELSNYTLEWWCKVTSKDGKSGFTKNNQAIFNSGSGSSELYLRFGDLIYSSGGRYQNNFLQVKTMGSQFDTGDPTKGEGLVAKEWYHFALTYDAATGVTILYKNGVQLASLTTSAGKKMIINQFHMICSGSEYFVDYCEMCQVRLWKVTRTPNQIKKSMYFEVEHTNKDLLLYLPMNEGSGDTLHDVTGNGHDVVIGSMYPEQNPGNKTVTWDTYLFAQ